MLEWKIKGVKLFLFVRNIFSSVQSRLILKLENIQFSKIEIGKKLQILQRGIFLDRIIRLLNLDTRKNELLILLTYDIIPANKLYGHLLSLLMRKCFFKMLAQVLFTIERDIDDCFVPTLTRFLYTFKVSIFINLRIDTSDERVLYQNLFNLYSS